jgi:UDP-N-acetylglucosamine acyltransferase
VSHQIHKTAVVDPRAKIGANVTIGPYTVVDGDVEVGEGTTIGAHNVITGVTKIGRGNRIYHFCSIGEANQDKKYQGEPTRTEIGDGNTIRESVSINRGTVQGGGLTRLGDDNWLMAYVHIAHDCLVGSHTVFANNASLAGHVLVDDWVTLGGFVGVHQFVKVGAHVMVGFASAVSQDVPPFMLVDGNPLAVRGVNAVGLRRRDFDNARIAAVKQMHKLLYREGRTLEQARDAIDALAASVPEAAQDVALMSRFLSAAARGIAR